MSTIPEFTFSFGNKISEKHLDKFIHDFYVEYPHVSEFNGRFIFDLSNVEWIANQELLVLSGLLKNLILNNVNFKANFLKNGSSLNIGKRKATQIAEIWDTWGIYKITTPDKFPKYFDIDGGVVGRIKTQYNIRTTNKIYSRFGITQFLELYQVKNYEDKRIEEMMHNIYQLNYAINEILEQYNCVMPFENSTLSSIITKELYENFLDHFGQSIFKGDPEAFMSLSLKAKLSKELLGGEGNVQRILETNFQEENIPETRNFNFDSRTKKFRNQSVLQLSFVDFGEGISHTLQGNYLKVKTSLFNELHYLQHIDSRVLEYAFRHDASKDPISKKYLKGVYIPRGLFDVLSIVKRFSGLLVARSNYGKVLFDFSGSKSLDKAVSYFGDDKKFFPGTLISIYIPERPRLNRIEQTVIKPQLSDFNFGFKKYKKRISLFDLQKKIGALNLEKDELYNAVFENLIQQLTSNNDSTLTYIDFEGYDIDERISKKIIYFLIADYHINQSNTIIIINPPPKKFLDSVQNELLLLSEVVKSYKIHPTPFVYFDKNTNDLSIYWLGVFNDQDILKLNDLLFEFHDLRKSDFKFPEQVFGNVNYFDMHGNLKSFINRSELVTIYSNEVLNSKEDQIKSIITQSIIKPESSIFLCNGNYYQYEYIQLMEVLSDQDNKYFLCNELLTKLFETMNKADIDLVVGVTISSQKIIDHIRENQIFENTKIIELDNYHSFFNEERFQQKIKPNDKVLLVCDVISTGFLVANVTKYLEMLGAELFHIAVLVDVTDDAFEKRDERRSEKAKYAAYKDKLTSVYQYPIKKYYRADISGVLIDPSISVIRINPYTNAPITLSLSSSNHEETVRLTNHEFLDVIKDEHVKAGYYKFNNLIHPYFFDMDKVLADNLVSNNLLKLLFDRLDKAHLEDLEIILYPKNSGVANINFDYLKDEIIKNQGLYIIQLERFPTNEGWRFPNSTKYLHSVTRDRKIMILDDGSCSGDSLIQMIDEAMFLNVKEIVVLSIIGRINDHKRDFLSRLRVIQNKESQIKVSILFGSHWHIPTYFIEESPIIKERQWLDEILDYPNLPDRIKNTAMVVQGELNLKNITAADNRFILKRRDNKSIVKELILAKEEIGKITSYRFYKEYFNFFDNIISTYERLNKFETRYQKIELICGVFLHEPYLFPKMRTIIPDLVEKLEEFTETILFGNPKRERKKLPMAKLFYHWYNKDIAHLFFIVFEDEALFEILDSDKLSSMLKEFGTSDSDTNYILLKLLKYLPLKTEQITQKQYAGQVRRLIDAVIEKNELKPARVKKLKRFRSFITTLPFAHNDFDSALTLIKDNYSKLTDDKYHNTSISVQQDILATLLEILSEQYDHETEVMAVKVWENISPFIEDLLSFSKSYPSYFACCDEYVYANLNLSTKSLRNLHGYVSEKIYTLNQKTDFLELRDLVKRIYENFVISKTEYFQIFNNISTNDFLGQYNDFRKKLEKDYPGIDISAATSLRKKIAVSIPEFYIKEILFPELLKNFRHCDLSEKVYISFHETAVSISLTILNARKVTTGGKDLDTGGGAGLSKLERFKQLPNNVAAYTSSPIEGTDKFTQTIEFKKI